MTDAEVLDDQVLAFEQEDLTFFRDRWSVLNAAAVSGDPCGGRAACSGDPCGGRAACGGDAGHEFVRYVDSQFLHQQLGSLPARNLSIDELLKARLLCL